MGKKPIPNMTSRAMRFFFEIYWHTLYVSISSVSLRRFGRLHDHYQECNYKKHDKFEQQVQNWWHQNEFDARWTAWDIIIMRVVDGQLYI